MAFPSQYFSLNTASAESKKEQILLIDNDTNDLKVLSRILTKEGYEVHSIQNSSTALSIAKTGWAKLILLDITMPEMSGYEVCQQLKSQEHTQDIPIIFLSASNDPFDKVKAFHVGGSDYITKPYQREEILVRVETQLQIRESRIELHQINEKLEVTVRERTAELEITNKKLQQEIVQRKQAQDRLLKLALNDPITGLPNRNSCLSSLKQALQNIKKKSDYNFAVLLIKCDRFQEIKCYLGHLATNQLLIEIARCLGSIICDTDFLGLFENNGFVVILNNIKDREEVIKYVEKIQEKFQQPLTIFSPIPEVDIARQEITISCNMGVVMGQQSYKTEHDLLQDAEIAAYQASQSKEDSYHLFSSGIVSESYTIEQKQTQLQAEKNLWDAFKLKQFIVYYQPIFDIQRDTVIGFEALLRQRISNKKIILPKDFFRTAEMSDLSIKLSNFVLQQSCLQIKKIHQQHDSQKHLFITINLSKKQFLHPELTSNIKKILQNHELASQYLNFDISELVLTNNQELIKKSFKEFKDLGIKFNIDDFASSLEALKSLGDLSPNNLKIDYSLISKIESDKSDLQINVFIKNIIDLAHKMNMTVTAEGIETEVQLNFLKSLGCDYGQGFFFAKPLASQSIESFLLWRM